MPWAMGMGQKQKDRFLGDCHHWSGDINTKFTMFGMKTIMTYPLD